MPVCLFVWQRRGGGVCRLSQGGEHFLRNTPPPPIPRPLECTLQLQPTFELLVWLPHLLYHQGGSSSTTPSWPLLLLPLTTATAASRRCTAAAAAASRLMGHKIGQQLVAAVDAGQQRVARVLVLARGDEAVLGVDLSVVGVHLAGVLGGGGELSGERERAWDQQTRAAPQH
jgi:hypothetical protein